MPLLKTTITILLAASISHVCYAFSKIPTNTATFDSCPAENTIQQTGATYTAPGGWTGQIQRNPGKIKAFEMVLYKPNDTDHPFEEGQLLRCSYKLYNNTSLDLRLPEPNDKARISANDSINWESAYDGNQYDCSESRLACKFNLAK